MVANILGDLPLGEHTPTTTQPDQDLAGHRARRDLKEVLTWVLPIPTGRVPPNQPEKCSTEAEDTAEDIRVLDLGILVGPLKDLVDLRASTRAHRRLPTRISIR